MPEDSTDEIQPKREPYRRKTRYSEEELMYRDFCDEYFEGDNGIRFCAVCGRPLTLLRFMISGEKQ